MRFPSVVSRLPARHCAALVSLFTCLAASGLNAQRAATPESPLARRLVAEARTLLVNYPRNERMQLAQSIVQYYLSRDDIPNAIELAVQVDGDGNVFGAIAGHQAERGRFAEALHTASLSTDTGAVAAVLTRVAQVYARQRRIDSARSVLARISDPGARMQALVSAAQSVYPRDSTMAPLLHDALALARIDTSPNLRWQRDNIRWTLLEFGDWSGVTEANHEALAPAERVQFLVNLAMRLHNSGDRRADSVYLVARGVIDRNAAHGARPSLLQTYARGYRPGAADSNYTRVAESFDDISARNIYLSRVAASHASRGDSRTPLRIAEDVLLTGDTTVAVTLLWESANALANMMHMAVPDARGPGAAALLERMTALVSASPRGNLVHYRDNAMATLVRVDFPRARQLVADSGIKVLTGWSSNAFINALMNVDMRAAARLAREISDTARSDQLLQSIASRQAGAGYLDDASKTIAAIRSPDQRSQAALQVAQQRLQSGDTTGVRAAVRDVMHSTAPRRNLWQLSYPFAWVAMRSGMTDEVLQWCGQLPEGERAYVLVALLTRIQG